MMAIRDMMRERESFEDRVRFILFQGPVGVRSICNDVYREYHHDLSGLRLASTETITFASHNA